jgi:hypothetical protein
VLPLCDAIRMGVMDVGAAAEFPSSHRHLLQGGMPACGLPTHRLETLSVDAGRGRHGIAVMSLPSTQATAPIPTTFSLQHASSWSRSRASASPRLVSVSDSAFGMGGTHMTVTPAGAARPATSRRAAIREAGAAARAAKSEAAATPASEEEPSAWVAVEQPEQPVEPQPEAQLEEPEELVAAQAAAANPPWVQAEPEPVVAQAAAAEPEPAVEEVPLEEEEVIPVQVSYFSRSPSQKLVSSYARKLCISAESRVHPSPSPSQNCDVSVMPMQEAPAPEEAEPSMVQAVGTAMDEPVAQEVVLQEQPVDEEAVEAAVEAAAQGVSAYVAQDADVVQEGGITEETSVKEAPVEQAAFQEEAPIEDVLDGVVEEVLQQTPVGGVEHAPAEEVVEDSASPLEAAAAAEQVAAEDVEVLEEFTRPAEEEQPVAQEAAVEEQQPVYAEAAVEEDGVTEEAGASAFEDTTVNDASPPEEAVQVRGCAATQKWRIVQH